MALTSKPISTISYNTRDFLIDKLDRLMESKKFDDYRLIFHYGEDGDKDHWHVWIQPNKRLDTGELKDVFNEVDPDKTKSKPLGVLPFRSSDPLNWIMYVIHDPLYLKSHHSDSDGDGKIEYPLTDIITPYEDQLMRDYKRALSLRKTSTQKIIDGIRSGQSATDLAYNEGLQPYEINAVFNMIKQQNVLEQEKEALEKQRERYQGVIDQLSVRNLQLAENNDQLKHQLNKEPYKEPESPFDIPIGSYQEITETAQNEPLNDPGEEEEITDKEEQIDMLLGLRRRSTDE